MKKFFLFSSFIAITLCSSAQSEKFINVMKSNIAAIDTSFKNPDNLLALVNNFVRIAKAEKNQWLPYYYAAFCEVNYAYMMQDKSKVDPIADSATWLINKADSLMPNNSEISCIKSMIASAHMMVDPMQRYMEYGQVAGIQLENAIQQDPTNPRPHFLKGQGLFYTPERFGGGCKTATEHLQAALDKYASFKPESEIAPNWGKQRVEKLLSECK